MYKVEGQKQVKKLDITEQSSPMKRQYRLYKQKTYEYEKFTTSCNWH